MTDVFISYARSDHKRVEPLAHALQELGLDVFFDVENIHGGDRFPDVIDRAVKEAGVVVGCWTPEALARDWVKTECFIGMERKVLVPLEFAAFTSLDVHAAFYTLNRLPLVDWRGERDHEGFRAVIEAIATKLNRPELVDRARATTKLRRTHATDPGRPPDEMDRLWREWQRLGSAADRAGLERLRAAARGTLIEQLVSASDESMTAELEEMARQKTGFVRTNEFLRGMTREQFPEFFGPRIAYADGLLGPRDILARWGLPPWIPELPPADREPRPKRSQAGSPGSRVTSTRMARIVAQRDRVTLLGGRPMVRCGVIADKTRCFEPVRAERSLPGTWRLEETSRCR